MRLDCVKEAKQKLRDYNAKKNAISATAEQIEMLEAEYTCVRSAITDATAARGGGNRREDAMLNNIAMRAELQTAHDIAVAWVHVVDHALSLMTREDRIILDHFYINHRKGHVERVCEKLHIEKSQVYERQKAAIRRFAMALYVTIET